MLDEPVGRAAPAIRFTTNMDASQACGHVGWARLAAASASGTRSRLSPKQIVPAGPQLVEALVSDLQEHGNAAGAVPSSDQPFQDEDLRSPELLRLHDERIRRSERAMPRMTWPVHSFCLSGGGVRVGPICLEC